MQPSSPYPEGSRQAGKRRLFLGKGGGLDPSSPVDQHLQSLMAGYEQRLTDRLEDGLRAIRQTGITLMHEIAGEVWRSAGGSKGDVQAQILERLSRDQAIRGLIAHSDERFQALAARTARLEDTLATIAESTRALKDLIARGVQTLHDTARSPALLEVGDAREKLAELETDLAATFERLDERDRILTATVQEQIKSYGSLIQDEMKSHDSLIQDEIKNHGNLVREQIEGHGSLVHQETGRIVQALEGYVKDGVGAMGRLAQRVGDEAESIGSRAEERLIQTVTEQIQLMYERLGIEARSFADQFSSHETWILRTLEASVARMDERLDGNVEKVTEVSRVIAGDLARSLESRVRGLAELVRSDSEVLRRDLRDAAAEESQEMARTLDERLGRLSETLTAVARWTVEEMTGHIGVETAKALEGRLSEIMASIDRNMVRMADTLETGLDRLGQSVGQRAAQAAGDAASVGIQATIGKLDTAMRKIEGMAAEIERIGGAKNDGLAERLDDRIAALARMIRSDNRVMVERLRAATELEPATQEPAKQALRAVKELQANLPGEIMDALDRRFAALAGQFHREMQASAESLAKAGDVLGQKVDRIASQIDQRHDPDMQSVIERMGDAMHALASLGRSESGPLELE